MKKRICSIILASVMTFASASFTAFAEGDSVHIKTPSRIFAGATFTLEITSEDSEFEYQWLMSDSEDGEYEEILTDTSATYIVTPRDKGKYIKARITNLSTDEEIFSDNSIYVENLGPVSRTTFSTEDINATMLTPAENKFRVEGQDFILLDEYNDSESRYYVLADSLYGIREFDTNRYAKFDPDAEGNMGNFLNGDFLTDGGNGKVLPDGIQEHIDFNHVWWTEGGLTKSKDAANSVDCPEDYSFTAGISLLSATEAIKYRSKYGWQPGGTSVVQPWWSRTQRGSSGMDDNMLAMMNTNDGGKGNMWDKTCTDLYHIRPAFYLDEDFFGQVKLDLNGTGENVKNIIADKYTVSELEALYSIEELIALGFDIKSTVIAKETVPGSGGATALVASMNDDEAVEFKYRWFISDSEEEQGIQVYGNTTDRYIIGVNDREKYVSVAVTPVYADGSVGEEVYAINKIYVDNIGGMSRTDYSSDVRVPLKNNPEEYMFTAGGEKMILLDAYEHDTDTLYVMTADAKGQTVFDSDGTQRFDPEDLNNIGYWLNNDFLERSLTISDKVQPYINTEHLWWTEAGHNKSNCTEDYTFTAGVSLLSRSEYSKYWGKFGWDNNDSIQTAWWLRTGRSSGVSDIFCGTGVKDGNYSNLSANGYGNTWNKSASASYYVRPTFYLTKDFLKNVKITQIGEKAAEAVRKVMTVDEFLESDAGYIESDLVKLGIIESPKAKNLKLDGKASVGSEIKGSYSYYGEKAEDGTLYGFEIADKENGDFKKLSDSDVYKITSSEKGKYIRFFVTPYNVDGVRGETYYSDVVKVIGEASVSAENVEVTDEKGNPATSLSRASELNVSVRLVNYASQAKDAWVMLYVYDADGNMLDNRGIKVNVPSGGTVTSNKLSIELPEYAEGNFAKLIIWDGLLTMNSAQNTAWIIQ